MERIEKLNNIQKESVEAWEKAGYCGTIMNSVRTGKTITSFRALYRLLEKGLVQRGSKVRFWAEQSNREQTLFQDEIPKFKKIFGKDVEKDFDVEFRCYQSGIDSQVDYEIYDEVDTALTPVYSKCIIDSTAKFKIGLTGTNNYTSNVYRNEVDPLLQGQVRQPDNEKEVTELINKGQLLDIILPVCYEYPMWEAIKDNIISPFETIVVDHILGTKDKYIKVFKKNEFLQSEKAAYDYLEKSRKNWNASQFFRALCGRRQKEILHNLKSKSIVINKLLKDHIKGNAIIFGITKKPLYEITPNVAESNTVDDLIDQFRAGKINEIATSKLIARGKSLPVNNVIFHSYYSTWDDLIQKLGRGLLYEEGKKTKVWIMHTLGTREENWFSKAQLVKDKKGNIVHTIDLNITEHIYSKNLWKKS